MNRQSSNTGRRFLIGTMLTCFLFAVSAVAAKAESAADYPALFNVISQFDPATLTTDGEGNYLLRLQVSGTALPGRFRVFIPVGAFQVNVNIFAAQAAKVGMAARYKKPLQCDYSQVSYAYWNCLPWDKDGGRLGSMTNADMRFRKQDGTAFVVQDYFSSALTTGGWLYLKVLDPDPSYSIYLFEYAVRVKGDAYRAWHALGTVPEATGTVSGGCAFAPAPDCSPASSSDSSSSNNTSNVTNPFDFLNNFKSDTNQSNTNLMDLLSGLLGGTGPVPGDNNPASNIKTRLDVEIDTTVNDFGSEQVITDSDLTDYSKVTLNPSLKFDEPPSEEVECFAMVVASNVAGFIYRETLFDGPSWLTYSGSDRVYRYGTASIAGKTTWVCNAFDFLKNYSLPPSFFTQNRLQFIYAIAPVGEVEMGKYENLRYGVITFRPDEETSPETEPPALEDEAPTEETPAN